MLFLSLKLFSYRLYEWLIFMIILIPQSIMDIKTRRVYLLPNILGALVFNALLLKGSLGYHLAAVMPGLLMIILSKMIKESLGTGDGFVMLALFSVTGPILGMKIMLVSSVISGIFAFVLLVAVKEAKKKRIPFVPFLLAGTIICGII